MRILVSIFITTVAILGCSDPTKTSDNQKTTIPAQENNNDLTVAEAKQLIPEAASITNLDFETLSKNPDPAKIESQTLSVVLLSLNPFDQANEKTAVSNEFKYLTDQLPTPTTIAKAMWRSKSKGYASMIQPHFITDCRCKTNRDTSEGTVAFTAEGLYSGVAEFTARRIDNAWRIEEFRLPNYGIKVLRGESGAWKQTRMEPNQK